VKPSARANGRKRACSSPSVRQMSQQAPSNP
jgi:hypothetical protein